MHSFSYVFFHLSAFNSKSLEKHGPHRAPDIILAAKAIGVWLSRAFEVLGSAHEMRPGALDTHFH